MNDFLDNLGANQYQKMHKTSRKMINPISVVKNTRMSYNRFLDKNVKEVLNELFISIEIHILLYAQ